MPSKSTFESPFYALIGAADAAVETVRNSVDSATESAQSLRDELTPENVQERILNTVNDVRDQIFAIPSLATERYELVAGNVERAYDDFAKSYLDYAQRGAAVTREATEQGRAVVSAARANASETGDSTLAAVFGVRKEAAKGVERLAGLVGRNAGAVEAEAETVVRSNAAKQGAAKRPTRSSVAKKATTKKAAAKKPVAKKAPAKKAAAKKAPAAKKATPAKTTAAVPTLPVEAKVEATVETTDNA
ncbi:MAG TPA: hypothetical protein VG502_08050 [Flexivirga sp.]|uniref:hypothetical protein n=1 Tax=Flexivirga sp. TaxID=1962927 RepID=UPI002C724FDE|nr:hypothetical protein [Flexivirga sp.]HWC22232.1 hypothetical protein [Flexivirga sp.]